MTKLGKSARRSARKKAAQQKSSRPRANSVLHATVRSTWDSRLTPEGNMSKIGLQASVNHIKKVRGKKEITIPVQKIPENAEPVLMELEKEASREEARNAVVHAGERRSLNAMIERYGSNWIAMSRDLKLNFLQWTPNQLERKVERMRLIDKANAG